MVDLLETRPALAPVINRPAEAVADAMMAAQAHFLALPLKLFNDIENGIPWPPISPYEIERFLKNSSKGHCFYGSVRALAFLAENYQDIFNYLLLLMNYSGSNRKFKDTDLKMHTYFLAKSKLGEWFAGSPANYHIGETEGPLTRVFYSRNLDQVMASIEETDGGEWPSTGFILKTLTRSYRRPKISNDDALRKIKFSKIVIGCHRLEPGNSLPRLETDTQTIV